MIAMEPIYWLVIVILFAFAAVQASMLFHAQRRQSYWHGEAQKWKRLAYDYDHHRIARGHVSRLIDERESDQ